MSQIPDFLHALLKEQYGAALTDQIEQGFHGRRPVTLRINTLKSEEARVKACLTAADIRFQTVPFSPCALILEQVREKDVQSLSVYTDGEIYLQSLSSMLPPLLLEPKEKECILDMAAAPGSKTTQLAALSGGRAQITACEKNPIRSQRLQYNLEKQGASRVVVMTQDARKLDPFFSFDKILLDAPCSGSGTLSFSDDPDGRLPDAFSKELLERSVKTQAQLLEKALQLLKPGGILLYSTCSILAEENERNLQRILSRKKARLVPLTLPPHWEIPLLPTQLEGTCCICPTKLYEGFFVAKLQKQ